MTSSPSVWPASGTSGPGDRRLPILVALAATVVAANAAAGFAGVPDALLTFVFVMAMLLLPPLGWCAFVRAPPELRALCGLLASAATLWLAGSLIWYYYFVSAGNTMPPPVGPWEIAFVSAYVLAVAGVHAALRRTVSLRRAALDASVVGAVGIGVGAALVGRALEDGITGESLVTLARPLFGLAIVTFVASAALAGCEGLRLSVLLVALGQACLTIDAVVYSYDAVQRQVVEGGWTDAGRLAGAVVSMLAAAVIILGIDRPVRLPRPPEPVGATMVLHAAFGGLAVTAAVAVYGYVAGRDPVLVTGLAASAWIGAVIGVRASGAIRDVDRASGGGRGRAGASEDPSRSKVELPPWTE